MVTNLEPCDKHDMIGCQVCSPPERSALPALEWESKVFPSRYGTHCDECEDRIERGGRMLVRYYEDGSRRILHETCA